MRNGYRDVPYLEASEIKEGGRIEKVRLAVYVDCTFITMAMAALSKIRVGNIKDHRSYQ